MHRHITGRTELEYDRMFACRNTHATQYPVRTEMSTSLPSTVAFHPAGNILRRRLPIVPYPLTLIGQTVRTVFFQHVVAVESFLRHKSFQSSWKRLSTQRFSTDRSYSRLLSRHPHCPPYQLRLQTRHSRMSYGFFNGLLFGVIDDIAGIQHIQGRTSSQRRHHIFGRLCFCKAPIIPRNSPSSRWSISSW
mgnify:CR=1 FL=1